MEMWKPSGYGDWKPGRRSKQGKQNKRRWKLGGKTRGESREKKRKLRKRKQNGIRAEKKGRWREGVTGRAGKVILNMENSKRDG